MDQYNIVADFLNKFSQLTPWVQAFIGLGICSVLLGTVYFMKEIVVVIMKPFNKESELAAEPKKEWKDSYYRGEER